jgi:hypothetical protein
MHGTYVEERKLVPHTRESLYSGDYIKFGAEVTRGPGTCWINDEAAPHCCAQPIRWLPLPEKGVPFSLLSRSNHLPESFPPLEMCISFDWVDEVYVVSPPPLPPPPPPPPLLLQCWTNPICSPRSAPGAPVIPNAEISRNSFAVPEYDDDEDDEIQIIHESVRAPRVEVVVPPHHYSVPGSDVSCAGSFTSDDSSSEPPTPNPRASRADVATWKQFPEKINAKPPGEVASGITAATERLVALSDAPSAAGFFHFEGQQPPTLSQTLSQPNADLEREAAPTAKDSVYAGEDALEDVDLTESDVESADESADGFSDDLFDEGGEGEDDEEEDENEEEEEEGDGAENAAQELNVESPPLSEIDDSEAEPQAGNSGAKLPDSNNHPEGQETREVGGEEHIRVSATQSEPQTVYPSAFDAKRWASSSSNQRGLVQKPNNNLNDARAPSPSDAAMAKTSIAQLPPMDTPMPAQSPPTLVAPMACGFPRQSTIETPYATPTWPAWQGYTADLPSEYAPFVYSPFNSQFPYQEGPLGYRQPADLINIDHAGERDEEVPTNYEAAILRPPYQPPNNRGNPPLTTAATATATALDADHSGRVPATTSLRATRVSIDDIVEKNTKDTSMEIDEQKLKRKAEAISADEDVLAIDPAPSSDPVVSELDPVPQLSESAQLATLQTVAPPTIDAEVNTPTPKTEVIEQPARKRAKTGVAKYAAAVFAGVVAGGVGTVAALLTLPTIQLT